MKRLLGCCIAACLFDAGAGRAQDTALTSRTVLPVVVLGAAAWAVMPVDTLVAKTVRQPEWVRTGFVHTAAEGFSFMGTIAPFVAGGTWAYGSLKDHRDALTVGRTTTQAILGASLITGALKFTLGRARPYVTTDSNARDFRWNRGWGNDDYRSMPSGHSTMAFAVAAVLSEEHARIHGRSRFVTNAAYATATCVALSRIVLDKHWASDILLGAGIGLTSGLVTFRLAH
jgi:membrane-associated phospholipid phosphatase